MSAALRSNPNPSGIPGSMWGAKLAALKDCPKCKHGTIDRRLDHNDNKVYWVCADCGYRFEDTETKGIK